MVGPDDHTVQHKLSVKRCPVKVVHIRPFFRQLYSTYGRVVYSQCLFWCNPGSNLLERLCCLNQILNADGSSFLLVYRSPGTLFFGRSTYLVSGPYLLCSSYAIFTKYLPAGPWRRKRHFEAINVPLLANEDVIFKLETPRVASLKRRRFSRPS